MELVIAIYVLTGLCLIDAARRSTAQWAEADRDKPYWIGSLAASGLFVLPAVVFVPAYLIGVVPRFGSHPRPGVHDPFAK